MLTCERRTSGITALTIMADMKQDVNSVEEQQNYAVGNNSDPKNVQELTQYVQTLLQGMQDKFQTMSDQIITRNMPCLEFYEKIKSNKHLLQAARSTAKYSFKIKK